VNLFAQRSLLASDALYKTFGSFHEVIVTEINTEVCQLSCLGLAVSGQIELLPVRLGSVLLRNVHSKAGCSAVCLPSELQLVEAAGGSRGSGMLAAMVVRDSQQIGILEAGTEVA